MCIQIYYTYNIEDIMCERICIITIRSFHIVFTSRFDLMLALNNQNINQGRAK